MIDCYEHVLEWLHLVVRFSLFALSQPQQHPNHPSQKQIKNKKQQTSLKWHNRPDKHKYKIIIKNNERRKRAVAWSFVAGNDGLKRVTLLTWLHPANDCFTQLISLGRFLNAKQYDARELLYLSNPTNLVIMFLFFVRNFSAN